MTEPLNAAAERLEPCPWCESADAMVTVTRPARGFCTACGAQGPAADKPSEAIAAWNRRSTPTAPAGEWVTVARDALTFYRDAWEWFAVGDEPDIVHGGGGITGYEAEPNSALKDDAGKRATEALVMISAAPASPGRVEEVARELVAAMEEIHEGLVASRQDIGVDDWIEIAETALTKARATLSASPVLSGGGMASVADSADAPCFAAAKDAHSQSEGDR